MKNENYVYETTDYAIFKTLKGNRKLNLVHVTRLTNSFEIDYLLNPIIVNEKFEIIDGQHRFDAARRIGKPIKYIIAKGYGLREVQMLNANMANWKKEDCLNAYCDLGYPEYLKFRNFMRIFPDLGITNCHIILNGSNTTTTSSNSLFKSATNKRGTYHTKEFEDGEFKISDYDSSVKNAKKIMMTRPYYSGFRRRSFVLAMISIFKIEDYNHTQFLKNLEKVGLQDCVNTSQYRLAIEDIYNYRSRTKISLRF